jgi:formiminotetrahydrofolate cyclodeaminase
LQLAEHELTAYAPVLEASRLPKEDPARAEKLDGALSDAADSPLEIARVAAEVAQLASELAATGNCSLEGDANAGAELARAACRAAARLVEINLAAHPDDPRLAQARKLVEDGPR